MSCVPGTKCFVYATIISYMLCIYLLQQRNNLLHLQIVRLTHFQWRISYELRSFFFQCIGTKLFKILLKVGHLLHFLISERNFHVGKYLELEMEFRTSELAGILLSISEPTGFPALSLELYNGNVSRRLGKLFSGTLFHIFLICSSLLSDCFLLRFGWWQSFPRTVSYANKILFMWQ